MSSNSQLVRLLKEEKLKRLLNEAYRKDPLFWLEHRLGEKRTSFEWSKLGEQYEGHTWDGDMDPLAEAWRALAQSYIDISEGREPSYRNVGIEAGTGTSKTYMLARIVVWFMDVFENSLVVTSAPKQDQLKIGLWSEISMIMHKVRKFRPKSFMYKLRLVMDDTQLKDLNEDEDEILKSQAWQAIGFVAGVGQEEESATKARGFHRQHMLIILEECTGMPMPVMKAFENTCTGQHNLMLAVGNPNNANDPLHQFCIRPTTKHYRVSALDYPNIVLNKELFSGAVTNVSLTERKEVYGEHSPFYDAMVRGISPAQSEDSLIRLEWIKQCIDNEIENDETHNAVGVDVANSIAGDKAALAWGQKATLLELQEFQCKNATDLAYNLLYSDMELAELGYVNYGTNTIKNYDIQGDCIGVDSVGVGVATVNAFLSKNLEVQSLSGGIWEEAIPVDSQSKKPMYKFQTLRAQMYWELREDLRLKRINIHVQDKQRLNDLIKELVIPKFDPSGGFIAVEKKESIKQRLGGKSPNLADAVVYWNWTRKGYRLNRYGLAAIFGG